MDEARSQLLIRKGLLTRARVTGDTRGAGDARRFRSFALGTDRPLPPAAPIEHEQPTGVGSARFDQQPTIPRAGHP